MQDNIIIAEWIEAALATRRNAPRDNHIADRSRVKELQLDNRNFDNLRNTYEQLLAHLS